MRTSEYLRQQADNCMRIARAGFDLATAERLRHMAAELRSKADEIDAEEDGSVAPHMMNGNGSTPGNGSQGDFERG
jgi:hypothetical protein